MRFAKGHGTGNDFVILPDPDGELDLTPNLVRAVCDRRFGLGGDGVLRVVRAAKHPEAARYAAEAEWFMDYHNSDGSLSEMCGNGARVFARYLVHAGLAEGGTVPIATRAGVVTAVIGTGGVGVTVDMVYPVIDGSSWARLGAWTTSGTVVSVGNPHLVCPVDPVDELDGLDLSGAPVLDPEVFPRSANVEFVVPDRPVPGTDVHMRMRVYERGSAETLSCGSGACAVAAVALRQAGLHGGTAAVDLPGGRLIVAIGQDPGGADQCWLTGPAVLVAEGEVDRAALGPGNSPVASASSASS